MFCLHGKEKALLTKFVETACIVVPLPKAHHEPTGRSCTGTYITFKIREVTRQVDTSSQHTLKLSHRILMYSVVNGYGAYDWLELGYYNLAEKSLISLMSQLTLDSFNRLYNRVTSSE